MKKRILIAVIGVVVLASCRKEYTCTCTYSGDFTGTASETVKFTDRKSGATTSCKALETSYRTCAIQ